MDRKKQIWKNYLIRMAFIFAMLGFCFWNQGAYVQAEDLSSSAPATTEPETGSQEESKPTAVVVEWIDYEQGTIQIAVNNNTKVYYSDSAQKTWNVIEGAKQNDRLTMDISWISVTKDYELNLKGSDDDTVVTVELPKYNSTLKAVFDKVDGTIDFTNEEGAENFQWRKATATGQWNTATIDMSKDGAKEFLSTVEGMRVKGGKIQVRIPQKTGDSTTVGSRPSKIVTVSITKRGNAPSVKVTANTMTVNTTDKMEYKLVSVGGSKQSDAKWTECDKKMSLSNMAPQVLTVNSGAAVKDAVTVSGSAAGKDVMVAVRKKATEKAPYSKTYYLTIPAQPGAPDASKFSTSKTSSKFSLIIGDASKYNQYQYAVVEAGRKVADSDLKWKAVTSTKEITFKNTQYPAGSTIYVRTKGENQTKKVDLKLPSAYTTVSISYLAEAEN